MQLEEGALLLLRRAGLVAKDASFASAKEAERSVALQISRELGGLPLALQHRESLQSTKTRTSSGFVEDCLFRDHLRNHL